MAMLRFGCGLIAAAVTCASYGAQAEVTRIEIASRTDVLGGKPFGTADAYEKIVGKVFFSVDPAHPRNKAIVDLDRAPRDAAGRVTFSADLYVLSPKDAAPGNGVALFDVLNRGRKNMLRDFNRAPPVPDPTAEADFGDGFLMRQGYTLVWVGWQFDIPRRNGLMALDAPPAFDQGKPITGRVSTTFTPKASTRRSDRSTLHLCLRSLAGRPPPAGISLSRLQRRRRGPSRFRWRDLPHRRLRAQRRLQFALCAAERSRLFRGVAVSLSRS